MVNILRSFAFSSVITVAVYICVLIAGGWQASVLFVIVASIELAFSIDNSVVNAKVLGSLSDRWQHLFLTVGVIIAIFGTRLFLPLVLVGVITSENLLRVLGMALSHPAAYEVKLHVAQPIVASFGGAFLLMLALRYAVSERDYAWLSGVRRRGRLGAWLLPITITIAILLFLAAIPWNRQSQTTIVAGMSGLLCFEVLNGLTAATGRLCGADYRGKRIGWAAFATFMYLELLDASLSFDGIIGAFAITANVIIITLGLGIGAVWVRTLTVYMVRHHTLQGYRYLDRGAHYAIGVLAIILLLGTVTVIPNLLTGFLCLGIITGAIFKSNISLQSGESL